MRSLKQLRLRSPFYFISPSSKIEAPAGEWVRLPLGKVVTASSKPEYNPNQRGGVVRHMPRKLRKIKEAQERPVDDV